MVLNSRLFIDEYGLTIKKRKHVIKINWDEIERMSVTQSDWVVINQSDYFIDEA